MMTSSIAPTSSVSSLIVDENNALLSLQLIAPHLTEEKVSNIYHNECERDFSRSVDYLMEMKKEKQNENSDKKIEYGVKPNANVWCFFVIFIYFSFHCTCSID